MDTETAAQVMSSAQQRKIRKPLVERKRRNRINGCLDKMKDILIDEDPRLRCRASKLEKADILELVLEHMQRDRYSSNSAISMNGAYEDGFMECVHTTLVSLNEMGMIANPRMKEMLKDKLLQHLLQRTTKTASEYVLNPRVRGMTGAQSQSPWHDRCTSNATSQVLKPDIHSLDSYGLSQEIQMGMPYVNITPGNLIISKVPHSNQVPMPLPSFNESSISQLSPSVITNQMSSPYTDAQFPKVSSAISQSLSKSRFVPYTNKTRRTLQNKNASSSGHLQTLPTTTERVRNDSVACSPNYDDIRYSIYPSESSEISDQPQSKESFSKSQKSRKQLQVKTRSESVAMPRKFDFETRRPLSTINFTDVVQVTGKNLQRNSLSMSMHADESMTSAESIMQGRHLVTDSSSSRSYKLTSMALLSKASDEALLNPTAERSVQNLSEELTQEDIWRPF